MTFRRERRGTDLFTDPVFSPIPTQTNPRMLDQNHGKHVQLERILLVPYMTLAMLHSLEKEEKK